MSEQLMDGYDDLLQQVLMLGKELDRLAAEVARLREALGRHATECAAWVLTLTAQVSAISVKTTQVGPRGPCTCGLDAALAPVTP